MFERCWLGVLLAAALLLSACASGDPGAVEASSDSSAGRRDGPTGLTGQVTDTGGQPLGEVLVQPVGIGESPQPVPEIAVFTGNDGRYTWRLRPGAYLVTASRAGFVDAAKRVRVEAGRMHRLDFVLGLEE